MREFRSLIAFASGVLFIIAALLVMFPTKAQAQSCGVWDQPTYDYYEIPGGQACSSLTGTRWPTDAAAMDACIDALPSECLNAVCGPWSEEKLSVSGSWHYWRASRSKTWDPTGETITDVRNVQFYGPQTDSTGTQPSWWSESCPQDCSAFANVEVPVTWTYGQSAPLTARPETDGYSCELSPTFGIDVCLPDAGICFGNARYTGNSLEAVAATDSEPDDPYVACAISDGQQHCVSTQSPNCGFVNGERWCAGNVAANGIVTAQGAVISADPGTVVDDLGNPVPPDSTVEAGGDTYNYWGAATVGANQLAGAVSGNPDQSGSGVPGAGSTGDGGPGSGDGTGEGEGEDPFTAPGLADGSDYGTSASGYFSDISGGPWGTALAGVGSGAGGGACPTAEFNWLDGTPMSIDFHCTLLADFEALIGLLFFFGWTWLAVRTLFSA